MFKVGDLVECIEDGHYNITDKGVICEVVDVSGGFNKLVIRPIKIKKSYNGKNYGVIKSIIKIGETYNVVGRLFKKAVKDKKSNI